MIKKFLFILSVFILLFSCSIDKMEETVVNFPEQPTFKFEKVEATENNPGGYMVYYIENGDTIQSFFISNGVDGQDGKDGLDGIDGIDGQDGVDVTLLTEQVENGYYLYITSVNGIDTLFIKNGTDGIDGLDGINGKDGVDGQDGKDGIDGIDGKDGVSVTILKEEVENGYILYITSVSGVDTLYITNGVDGIDGKDGLDGIDGVDGKDGQDGVDGKDGQDGVDGKDGTSSIIKTEKFEGGYYLYIIVGNDTTKITIYDGEDGTNGLDGINGKDGKDGVDGQDGQDGKDGVSCNIRTEEFEGGYHLYITVGDDTTKITIYDGQDGQDGQDGKDGKDGIDGINGDSVVCIRHELIGNEQASDFDHVSYDGGSYVILTLTLSDYVYHVYEHHSGSSTQGNHDSWHDCN